MRARKHNNREGVVTYQHILYEVSDKIATVTLNRPDRMNAWTAIMERDVRHAMEAAAAAHVAPRRARAIGARGGRRRCPRHRADGRRAGVLRRRRHGGAEGDRSQRD